VDEAAELGASELTLIGVLRDGGWLFVPVGFFARMSPADRRVRPLDRPAASRGVDGSRPRRDQCCRHV